MVIGLVVNSLTFSFNCCTPDGIEGHCQGKVPGLFPGTLKLTSGKDKESILHPDYRREASVEFEYFVENILERVRPRRTKYKYQKGGKLVSEIFTVSDEAFALFVLYNEHHVWLAQDKLMQEGKKGSELHLEKRFVNGRSGDKDGLPLKAMRFFNKLMEEVRERRSETKDMERLFMNGTENSSDIESGASDIESDVESTVLFTGSDFMQEFMAGIKN